MATSKPGPNSIENEWGIMKQKLPKKTVFPSNSNEVFSILYNIWFNMPDSYSHNLVSAMPSRVNMVKEIERK